MNFLKSLDSRRSIRHFDATALISNDEIMEILNHAANAPSGNNAQPWKVVVIKNKKLLQKLQAFSFNQTQVGRAAAVFLILGDKKNYNVDQLIQKHLKYKIINESQVSDKRNRIQTYYSFHPEDKEEIGLRLDIGLFSMNLMHVLRSFGYDSVPMRGVKFEKIMQLLELPTDWSPILLLPVGKATTKGHEHMREKAENFTTIIN